MWDSHYLSEGPVTDKDGTGAEEAEIERIREHTDVIASCGKKVGVPPDPK